MTLKKFEKYKAVESVDDIYQNIVDNNNKLISVIKNALLKFSKDYSLKILDMKVLSSYEMIYNGNETIETITINSYNIEYSSKIEYSNNSIDFHESDIAYMSYSALYEIYKLIIDLDIETILSYIARDGNKNNTIELIRNNIDKIDFEKDIQLSFDDGTVFYHLDDIKYDEEFQELIFDKDDILFANMINKYKIKVNPDFMKRRGDEIESALLSKDIGLY